MKTNVLELKRRKAGRLVMLTAYDYPSAKLASEAGVDLLLVGDSLGMVVLGYDSTVPVTMEEMLHHAKAARRGAPEAFIVADLPFLSYATPEQALANAARFMKEARADSVKLEGGLEVVPVVEALARAGVPVLGHAGLTPQTASALGGYKLQGKDEANARRILEECEALERAGCWGIVLEMVPAPLARLATQRLSIPTIGIGAGPDCDGQVLVFHDLVGLFSGFTPSFVKRYAEAGAAIRDAIARYAAEVRDGEFPGASQSFGMNEEVLERLYGR
ncbi:MAG: 3-methyl-2-oxobutanoate hydroxymethyltransferase [Betaproteobacteria bacterium RIFCSPLOWO2_12_FULL_68_20]|nr:MAG: 3-methyl-2-oxobutanoate hydroxymethyltransferase [Betaproteobacteria bacterium RIFCSPLOWO2_12_FULL_68_20]